MANIDGLDPSFRDKLMQLIAASDGRVYIVSAYRSPEEQQALWDEALAQYGSEEEARQWVAPPGSSNHNHGIAADIGGDLDWLGQHAADYGLYLPMDWEPWHVEPMGSRDTSSPDAYTIAPKSVDQYKSLSAKSPIATSSDPMQTLLGMLGRGNTLPAAFSSMMPNLARQSVVTPELGKVSMTIPAPSISNSNVQSASQSDIDRFMAAIRQQESSGDYGAYNPLYGASGAYQFLDSTWNYYGGYSRAIDAPPSVQDERARDLMSQYYAEYGNWDDVAAAWFSGPGGDWASGEVQSYVQSVKGYMG